VAAGTLGVEPGHVQASPQEMPAEKQKRKRKDAKASIEAKSTLVADAPNTTKGALCPLGGVGFLTNKHWNHSQSEVLNTIKAEVVKDWTGVQLCR
jgi:hypothetical protein